MTRDHPSPRTLSFAKSNTMPQTRSSPRDITVLHRVYKIPVIASSIKTLDSWLSSNACTRYTYSTAKHVSSLAYKSTEPLQIRLAPFILVANDYANKAVDVVESRYPYPFVARPEEVSNYIKERRDGASQFTKDVVNAANHTLAERVRNPVIHFAQGVDQ